MATASLEHTPTWVVAAVCFAIVSVSLAAERFLHYLGKSLKHKKQNTLYSALERLKEELMLLGFISFLLSLSQGFIIHICIRNRYIFHASMQERESKSCRSGWQTLQEGLCSLAITRGDCISCTSSYLYLVWFTLFSAATILLGVAKIRKWKHWEKGIHEEIQLKLRQTVPGQATPGHVFVSERTKGFWMKLAVVSWIIAFLKQFHDSVSKSDYEALRSAFVSMHYAGYPAFDFHNYIIRALEHDFKRVVSISWYLWLFVILFLLLNINGWHTYFWLAFLPLFVSYGFDSCMMEQKVYAISRLVIGLIIEVLCSYVTLPLYAIVTHMGGEIKLPAIGSGLEESVGNWYTGARKKAAGGSDVPVERIGSSRNMLAPAPPPDLDEIVSVDDENRR